MYFLLNFTLEDVECEKKLCCTCNTSSKHFFHIIYFSSVSNIIEEYEEQQERVRNQAKNTKSNQSTPNKRVDFNGLLGAGTTTNDVDFSFGGPVADEGGM